VGGLEGGAIVNRLTLRLLRMRERGDSELEAACSVAPSEPLDCCKANARPERADRRLLSGRGFAEPSDVPGWTIRSTVEPGVLDEEEEEEQNEAPLEELSEYGGRAKDTDFVVPVLDAAECHDVEEGEGGGAIMWSIGRGSYVMRLELAKQ
jgi:hypothetical protein